MDIKKDAIKNYLFNLVVADLLFISVTHYKVMEFFFCFQPTALEVYVGVIERKMLKTGIKRIGRDAVDWIHLVRGTGKWRALVNYGHEHSDSKNASTFFD